MNDDHNDDNPDHACKGRRNTTTDLPPLRSVLGDVLHAVKHPEVPNYTLRRASWHGHHLNPYAAPPPPPSPYAYDSHYLTSDRLYYHPRNTTDHPSPQPENHLRLPPFLYSPSSTESPLERSPDPYPPSSRENSPDVDMTDVTVPEPPPVRVTLKRRRRTNKAVTVVPCMIEAAPETRSPSAFNTLDLSEPAHPIDQDNGGRDGCRLLRIEVSGTKDGKLVYELEIPESLIKFDAPMPASPYDPHPCILCGNTFVSERHMNRHLLTHTDIKPYQCTHCSKSFARPDSMIRHKRNVHGVADSPLGPAAPLPGDMDAPPPMVSPQRVNAPPQGLGLGLHGESDMESE